jgi:phage shock protein PspC (stress-responsive transcriptional regulator)
MGTVDQIGDDGDESEAPKDASGDTVKDKSFPRHGKRLYRDSDNAILAGVCSGLASYFSIDPIVIRLIFIILTIANGIGILIYFVMWLIVPPAKTSMQKLEMQGEPISLENIEEIVKEKSEMLRKEGEKAFVSLRENKSAFAKIISLPIVIIEAIIRFFRSFFQVLFPIFGLIVGLIIICAVFFLFVVLSFFFVKLLFSSDSSFFSSRFHLDEIAGTRAYVATINASYVAALSALAFASLVAASLLARKKILNWTITAIIFAVFTLSVTIALVFGFDLAVESKRIYDFYNSQNIVSKGPRQICLDTAGNSWCESESKCYRSWEEDCVGDWDFSEVGRARKDKDAGNGDGLYLIYQDEEGSEREIALDFGAESNCGPEGKPFPCMALSVSDYGISDGVEIEIRGVLNDGVVEVRRLVRD